MLILLQQVVGHLQHLTPANGAVVTENSTFKAENHDFLTIKFKVKETANSWQL